MDYELAKKLKDAGFLQKPIPKQDEFAFNHFQVEGVHIPTLSELIEECGDGFFSLVNFKHPDFTDANEPYQEKFVANSEEGGIFYQGWTPEEAVSKRDG